MELLFTLAIFAAIGAVVWKKIQVSRARAAANSFEEDDAPRLIMSHAEIDEQHMRCSCGGKRIQEGEGPRGDLWRVLVRCGSCGRRRALLFQIAS